MALAAALSSVSVTALAQQVLVSQGELRLYDLDTGQFAWSRPDPLALWTGAVITADGRYAQTKRRLFERTGVREYWLVDPELDLVQVFRPSPDGKLTRVAELTAEVGDALATPLLSGCSIDLRELFRAR